MLEKLERLRSGASENVWVDPAGYQAAVAERERAFDDELIRPKVASGSGCIWCAGDGWRGVMRARRATEVILGAEMAASGVGVLSNLIHYPRGES
jgi:hypothetical protein